MKLFTSPSKYSYICFFSDKYYAPVLHIDNDGIVVRTRIDADDIKI